MKRQDIDKLFEDWWDTIAKDQYSVNDKPYIKSIWIWGFSSGVSASQDE